jgi:large subunit ribosomal protein L25
VKIGENGGKMSDNLTLKATKRDLEGPKPNALRREGNTPAVIHDHGKDSHHVVVAESDLKKVYSSAGKHHTVELDVEGQKFTTLIKEVTYKPSSKVVYHSVFQAVKANEKVSAEIPLKLSEDIPAEKASLLVMLTLDHLEVEALPKDLIDSIEVDGSVLVQAGDKIVVGDIKVPATITVKTDPEQLVATVETPRDQIAEADAASEEPKEEK